MYTFELVLGKLSPHALFRTYLVGHEAACALGVFVWLVTSCEIALTAIGFLKKSASMINALTREGAFEITGD